MAGGPSHEKNNANRALLEPSTHTMKTNVVTLHSRINDGRKPGAAGANAARPAMKPIESPDAASWHAWCTFITSIWCGASVGSISAAIIPPFPQSRS